MQADDEVASAGEPARSIVIAVRQVHPLPASQHELPAELAMPDFQWEAYCNAVRCGYVCRSLVLDGGPQMLIAIWQGLPEAFAPYASDEKMMAQLKLWQACQGTPDQFSVAEFFIGDTLVLTARATVLTVFLPWVREQSLN